MVSYELMRGMKHIFELRARTVKCASERGLSEVAQHYQTTRKTVRTWLRRSQQEGLCSGGAEQGAIAHFAQEAGGD